MKRGAEAVSAESERPREKLTVALLGEDRHTGARKDILRRAGYGVFELAADPSATAWDARIDRCEAAIVAARPSDIGGIAGELVKRGLSVLLESMPVSIQDSEALNRLAAEAGTEVAVSRPLRFHPDLLDRSSGRCALLTVDARMSESTLAWKSGLENIVDLSGLLCGTFNARSVDASAVRREGRFPVFVAFTMRFENGCVAQASFHWDEAGPVAERSIRVRCGRQGEVTEIPIGHSDKAVRNETSAFVDAVAKRTSGACSLNDGVRTARLVGRIMERLR